MTSSITAGSRYGVTGVTVLCPFDLFVETISRFLNLEIADHPVYDGLELQAFDDSQHGTGMLAFLSRRADRTVDFYAQPGLRLDPATFAIGAGIASWQETPFETARLDVAADGVAADVRFVDRDGRSVQVRIDDRDGHRRRRARMLAPVSAGIDSPQSLLLVYMTQFDLVRASGACCQVRIDGADVSTGALPGARLHRRRLVKYSAGLVAVTVNRQQDGPVRTVGADGDQGVELTRDDSISALRAFTGEHTAILEFHPAVPDLAALPSGASHEGTWAIDIDQTRITGGTWRITRRTGEVTVAMTVTRRWRPTRLPLLMRIVTTVLPTFRGWPTTYRWRARICLAGEPTMTSRWWRTAGPRGTEYRQFTRSDSSARRATAAPPP